MARLIHSPIGSGPQGPFEQELVETLVKGLPDSYRILPNFSVKHNGTARPQVPRCGSCPSCGFRPKLGVVRSLDW